MDRPRQRRIHPWSPRGRMADFRRPRDRRKALATTPHPVESVLWAGPEDAGISSPALRQDESFARDQQPSLAIVSLAISASRPIAALQTDPVANGTHEALADNELVRGAPSFWAKSSKPVDDPLTPSRDFSTVATRDRPTNVERS